MLRGRPPKIKKLRETIAQVRRNRAVQKTLNAQTRAPTNFSNWKPIDLRSHHAPKAETPLPENVIEVNVPKMRIPVRIQKPAPGQEKRISYQGNTLVVSNINGEIVTRLEKRVEEKKGQ